MRRICVSVPLWLSLLLAGACRQDMHDQPKYKPLTKSDFFGDDRAARPLVADTVARGHLKDDALLHTEQRALVDGDGRIRGLYNGTQAFDLDHLVEDARQLLR